MLPMLKRKILMSRGARSFAFQFNNSLLDSKHPRFTFTYERPSVAYNSQADILQIDQPVYEEV